MGQSRENATKEKQRGLDLPMDPEHDGQTARILRSEDVEEEAVLVVALVLLASLELRISERGLRTLGAVLAGVDDLAAVKQRRLRSLPSRIAGRRSVGLEARERRRVCGSSRSRGLLRAGGGGRCESRVVGACTPSYGLRYWCVDRCGSRLETVCFRESCQFWKVDNCAWSTRSPDPYYLSAAPEGGVFCDPRDILCSYRYLYFC